MIRKISTAILSIAIISIFCFTVHSQESQLVSKISSNISLFGIDPEENDSIYFLRIREDSTMVAKPSLIFLQGSLPIPLIIKQEGYGGFIPSLNFDYSAVSEKYNIIIISKPHTPVIADVKHLNDQYCYTPDTAFSQQYDTLYLKNNYREKYIARTNEVIKYLQNQDWVDSSKVYIVGHSEGASVAIGTANSNPSIKAVGYLSGNPMGRYAQYIHSQRIAEQKSLQAPEDSQAAIDKLYQEWRKIANSSIGSSDGDPSRTWVSFSRPIISEITNLEQPIFIGYGTEDPGGNFCDYLPIYLDIVNKTNYKLAPYIGRGHNFERVINNKPDFNDMAWERVMTDFLLWIESL